MARALPRSRFFRVPPFASGAKREVKMTRIPQTSSVTAGLLGASAMAVPARAYGFAMADASKVGVLTGDFLLGLRHPQSVKFAGS